MNMRAGGRRVAARLPVLLALLLSPAWSPGQGQQPAPSENPARAAEAQDPNPALLYWQAIALLPELKSAQAKVISGVLEGTTRADDEAVSQLLDATRRGLDRFARASRGTRPCVWGLTLDEGPFAPLPHLPKMQLLCRLALVQAESHHARAEPEEAWEWTRHVHAAARHVGAEPLLITVIVQHGLEQQALRQTARHALGLEVDQAAKVAASLRALPPLHRVKEALDRENAMADWLRLMVLGLQHTPQDEKAYLEDMEAHLRSQMEGADKAQAAGAQKTLAAMEEWKKVAAQAKDLQARTLAASELPWPAYQAAMQEIRKSLEGGGAMLKNTLPAFEGAMQKQFETTTLTDMLLAVLLPPTDGHEDGEMPGTKDAFEGRPFLLKRGATEWTVSTQATPPRRPLTLRVARQ